MGKKKPKRHFQQVSLKDLEKLRAKKTTDPDASPRVLVERPASKTEAYSIPFIVNTKESR